MNRFKFPAWEQLPDMGLYMDQVITFLNDRLSCLYFNDEKFVTNSMINNYVKAGLVRRPEKKHYTRTHLAYFIVVTILKRCYSMSQIDSMIQIQTHMDNSSIHSAYDVFIQRFEDSLNAAFSASFIKSAQNTCFPVSIHHEKECVITPFSYGLPAEPIRIQKENHSHQHACSGKYHQHCL